MLCMQNKSSGFCELRHIVWCNIRVFPIEINYLFAILFISDHNGFCFCGAAQSIILCGIFLRYIPWGVFHQDSVQSTVRATVRWHSRGRSNRYIWAYHNCPIVGMLLYHAIGTHLYTVYPIEYAHGFDIFRCSFTFSVKCVLMICAHNFHGCFTAMWGLIRVP